MWNKNIFNKRIKISFFIFTLLYQHQKIIYNLLNKILQFYTLCSRCNQDMFDYVIRKNSHRVRKCLSSSRKLILQNTASALFQAPAQNRTTTPANISAPTTQTTATHTTRSQLCLKNKN